MMWSRTYLDLTKQHVTRNPEREARNAQPGTMTSDLRLASSIRQTLGIIVELYEILFPFHGQQLFLGIVAFLAAGRHIALGAFAAAGNGHNVIHGQILGRKRPAAVMANPFCQSAFPPLRFS